MSIYCDSVRLRSMHPPAPVRFLCDSKRSESGPVCQTSVHMLSVCMALVSLVSVCSGYAARFARGAPVCESGQHGDMQSSRHMCTTWSCSDLQKQNKKSQEACLMWSCAGCMTRNAQTVSQLLGSEHSSITKQRSFVFCFSSGERVFWRDGNLFELGFCGSLGFCPHVVVKNYGNIIRLGCDMSSDMQVHNRVSLEACLMWSRVCCWNTSNAQTVSQLQGFEHSSITKKQRCFVFCFSSRKRVFWRDENLSERSFCGSLGFCPHSFVKNYENIIRLVCVSNYVALLQNMGRTENVTCVAFFLFVFLGSLLSLGTLIGFCVCIARESHRFLLGRHTHSSVCVCVCGRLATVLDWDQMTYLGFAS